MALIDTDGKRYETAQELRRLRDEAQGCLNRLAAVQVAIRAVEAAIAADAVTFTAADVTEVQTLLTDVRARITTTASAPAPTRPEREVVLAGRELA